MGPKRFLVLAKWAECGNYLIASTGSHRFKAEYIERGVVHYQMGRNADLNFGQSWAAYSDPKIDRVSPDN